MEWLDILENRHTTFAWDEERIPTKEEIEDVLIEVYTHIPSKNLQFPYSVHVLRNDDPAIRKEIMTICHRNQEKTAEEDNGNPQVLAPWLLGFSSRWVSDTEVRHEKTSSRGQYDGIGKYNSRTNDPEGHQTQTENIEIGIFSAYVMLALSNRGMNSGMCQNICNDYKRAEEIFRIHEDERAMDFRFLIGVGYGKSPDYPAKYIDPRTDKERYIPFLPKDVDTHYPRPEFEKVVKFL